MPATPRPDCQPTSPATYEKRALTAPASASTCAAADGQQMSFAARKQLQDKAQSLLRGLEHVQSCRAGDACGSALCHSTKRLLRTYATHECPRRATEATAAADCRVCRLWQFLLAERNRKSGERAAAAVDMAPPVVRPVCGLSALARRLSTRPAPASIRRRVLVAAREAATSRRI